MYFSPIKHGYRLHNRENCLFFTVDDNDGWRVFVFVAKEFEGELVDSNEGNLKWIDNNELLNLNLWDGDKIFLKWLDQTEFFSGKFIYENGKLINHSVVFHK